MERAGRITRVGHRGAGAFEPGNTLRSFRRALADGVEMIEVDLRQSGDGALVLAHDPFIRSTSGEALEIDGCAIDELRRLDLGEGERVPLLRDAIDLCRDRCALMIDLKGEGFERDLVDQLHASRFDDVVIPGGGVTSRRRLRELDSTLPLSLSLGREWSERVAEIYLDAIETDAVTWHYSLLEDAVVTRLHERGIRVFAWTVDDAGEMRRLLEAGVDGIISNRTDLLRHPGMNGRGERDAPSPIPDDGAKRS